MTQLSLRLLLCAGIAAATVPAQAAELGWAHYGGDAGGQRYSLAAQINVANVRRLKPAWTYSTGDLASKGAAMKRAAFENTPILAGGRLWVASGDGLLRAFSPVNGALLAEVPLPGGAAAPPAVAGGVMYVVSGDGKLLAFQ